MAPQTTAFLFGSIAALFFGMSKTGVPGIAIPGVLLMTLAFPGEEKLSTGAVLPLLILADFCAVAYYRSRADWRRIRLLLPSVFVGLLLGTMALRLMDHAQFKSFLAVLVLSLLAFEQFRRWRESRSESESRLPKSRWFAWFTGLLSGFTTQVGNAAGPVMSVYMAAQNLPKQDFMGTWSVFFLIVNLSKLPLIAGVVPGLNMVTRETLLLDLKLLPALLVGVLLGRKIFLLIPERYFVPSVLLLNLLVPLQMLLFR